MKQKKEIRCVILADTDDGHWWAEAITPSGTRRLNWSETLYLVWIYLKYGRGSLMKRCISVLIRALTLRLKPSQLPS